MTDENEDGNRDASDRHLMLVGRWVVHVSSSDAPRRKV
jgi:hypothetical protein